MRDRVSELVIEKEKETEKRKQGEKETAGKGGEKEAEEAFSEGKEGRDMHDALREEEQSVWQ